MDPVNWSSSQRVSSSCLPGIWEVVGLMSRVGDSDFSLFHARGNFSSLSLIHPTANLPSFTYCTACSFTSECINFVKIVLSLICSWNLLQRSFLLPEDLIHMCFLFIGAPYCERSHGTSIFPWVALLCIYSINETLIYRKKMSKIRELGPQVCLCSEL